MPYSLHHHVTHLFVGINPFIPLWYALLATSMYCDCWLVKFWIVMHQLPPHTQRHKIRRTPLGTTDIANTVCVLLAINSANIKVTASLLLPKFGVGLYLDSRATANPDFPYSCKAY